MASSTTNDREPPPTHLADVLGGFLIDSHEGSGLKQLECSTKKLMLSKTKLGEDIPGGSSPESVPTSDELDHGALIADPTGSIVSSRLPEPRRVALTLRCCSIVASILRAKPAAPRAWLSGKTVGETIRFTVSAPVFHRAGDRRNPGEPHTASSRARSRQWKWRAIPHTGIRLDVDPSARHLKPCGVVDPRIGVESSSRQ